MGSRPGLYRLKADKTLCMVSACDRKAWYQAKGKWSKGRGYCEQHKAYAVQPQAALEAAVEYHARAWGLRAD